MTQFKVHVGAASLAALLVGTPALADVTAEEVWQAWIDYYSDMGQQVETGGQQRSGDTLVITDAVFSGTQPEMTFSLAIPEIRLRETGGTVVITTSEEMPISVSGTGEAGEEIDMSMLLRHSGMVTTASGTPDDMTYEMTAPELAFTMGDMTVDDTTMEMAIEAVLTGSQATYRVTKGAVQRITSEFDSESVAYAISATDPEGSGRFEITGMANDLSGTSDASLPEAMNPEDMPAALAAGLDVTGTLASGSGRYSMDFADEGETFQIEGAGQGGTLDFSMSQDGLRMSTVGRNNAFSMTSSSLPFPVNLSLAESGYSLVMPVASGPNAPFGLGLRVVDLVVPEEIWAMIDPTGQLPRDPATLIVEVAGRANMLVGLVDPAAAELKEPPGELEALDLTALRVRLAGAELTGEGALTFDGSDMSMGFPKPLGALDFALTGGNALLDKLVAMGLLPEDQAMGARMMMGLFAVPTGPDALSSKIEFRDDGGIYANGQRLQ